MDFVAIIFTGKPQPTRINDRPCCLMLEDLPRIKYFHSSFEDGGFDSGVAELATPEFRIFCRPLPHPTLVSTASLLRYFYERFSQCKNTNAWYAC